MEKTPVFNNKVDGAKKIEQLETEVSILRDAYFQLEKVQKRLSQNAREIKFLYEIENFAQNPDISLEKILKKAVDLVPSAWQYPDMTHARISFGKQELKTKNFKETNWKQSYDIKIHGAKFGSITVYYQEKRPESPYLKEERKFMETIAEQLGSLIDHNQEQRYIKAQAGIVDMVKESLNRIDAKKQQAKK